MHYKVDVELFNALTQVAAQAPVPYIQTHGMWKRIEGLRTEEDAPVAPAASNADK